MLDDFIKEAKELSKIVNIQVFIDFNGIILGVDKDTDIHEKVSVYEQLI